MYLPENMQISEQGILKISGVSCVDLAKKYATPLLVLDEVQIRDNINKFKEAFIKSGCETFFIAYASKAFLNSEMCKIIDDEEIGLEVVSGGELYIALRNNFPSKKIYFNGNNKLGEEIEMAIKNDVSTIVVDNEEELYKINKISKKYGKNTRILLRIIPKINPNTHKYLSTGQIDSKFGIHSEDLLKVTKNIKGLDNLELNGIHSHIGSQISEPMYYLNLVETLFDSLITLKERENVVLNEIDIGGGFGISHSSNEKSIDIFETINKVVSCVKTLTKKFEYPMPKISIEPGRSIISTAGTTLYTVGSIKKSANKKYIIVDGGMTDNIRPCLYDAKYQVYVANKMKEVENFEKVTIAGRACESGDILIEETSLPRLSVDDLLAIPFTGDYTYSMSSNYNGFLRPAIVLVNEGKHKLITRREVYEDLVTKDITNNIWQTF